MKKVASYWSYLVLFALVVVSTDLANAAPLDSMRVPSAQVDTTLPATGTPKKLVTLEDRPVVDRATAPKTLTRKERRKLRRQKTQEALNWTRNLFDNIDSFDFP